MSETMFNDAILVKMKLLIEKSDLTTFYITLPTKRGFRFANQNNHVDPNISFKFNRLIHFLFHRTSLPSTSSFR